MLKNYFSIAFRNFLRNKIFSLINILGLSIGISASLVIYLLVAYDFGFDKFHKDGDRIYRVVSNLVFSGESYKNSGVPYPMPKAVHNEVSGLDEVAAFRSWEGGPKVSVPGTKNSKPLIFKKQSHIIFADENYFKLIEYNWVAGSPKTSLNQPYQIVLTQSNAKLYFPRLSAMEAIGKELYFDDTIRATVTGIVKDLEQNTDFSFKTFISRASLETTSLKPNGWDDWGALSSSSQLLIKLSPGTTTANIQTQIAKLFKKYYIPNPSFHSTTEHLLQPLSDIHFNTDYDNFNQRLAHRPTLYGLLAVAAFLLLLACINFINLTTAQASQRAKEIGIRKTMGSSRKQLIFQFLSETFLLTLIATILSIALTPLLLKMFAAFVPEGLHFNLFKQPDIIIFLSILILTVSLLSGFYPALLLSSYKPVLALKNQAYSNTGKTRNAWLRKTLTISQFVIAQVFIIATMLVGKQISYTLNKDLGFKKNAILYFTTNFFDKVHSHKSMLMDKLKAIPEIAMVSLSSDAPSSDGTSSYTLKYKDGKKEVVANVQTKMGDANYIKLFHIKLLAGNNFSPNDTAAGLVVNETYAHILGFTNLQQAVGKYIEWGNDKRKSPIIGVVQDFHQQSLHEIIKPLFIASIPDNEYVFNVALQPKNAEGTIWKTAITKIQKAWKEVYPEDDFEYAFLDETIAKYYGAEQNISALLRWATGLAIFISCLGLLGLVIYITNQKTKEIGIRKVVGASVIQLVALLSKDFLRLVMIAFIIAVPIAWWGAHKWLENFAYKTTLSWWIFLAGGITMLIMAFIILSIRTFKAANANPVKSLRTE